MDLFQEETKLDVRSWCTEIDQIAKDQIENLRSHPALCNHIAIMPDCHGGYGVPIGSVITTSEIIIPNAVGVDIGCGMQSVQTKLDADKLSKRFLKKLSIQIRNAIPVGFNKHKDLQKWEGFDNLPNISIIHQELDNAKKSLGTLGGGNHFIEIQKDEENKIWIMLHSGSRNLGLKIAKFYHDLAVKKCSQWFSNIPTKDLAFLRLDENYGENYFNAMNFASDFALENRTIMLNKVINEFQILLKKELNERLLLIDSIDSIHNYASIENHFGRNLVIHRKGATNARKGELVIIPGSMGAPSYIAEGLGNVLSFQSCSHGAGRVMGRLEASRILNKKLVKESMKNIVHNSFNTIDRKGNIDLGEAPQAYKNIEDVMNQQKDLVKPIHKLNPICVIKA